MKKSIIALKSFFQTGDKPKQQEFSDLIDSFIHKDDGVAINNIDTSRKGDITFSFTDGSTVTINKYTLPIEMPISFIVGLQEALENKVDRVKGKQLTSEDFTTVLKEKLELLQNYVHPETHSIEQISGLDKILDDTVSKSKDVTIAGKKVFTEIVELLSGLKISNLSGKGLRNLVIQSDGTVAVQAIATDVFVEDMSYDDVTKKITLKLINGTSIDVDLSGLEEDLTGLQESLAKLDKVKLDKGSYTGTAQDLENNKRNKTAFAKSITDFDGNLELKGDSAAPGSLFYYGTNNAGANGYYRISPVFFNISNRFLGGSLSNNANQEVFVNLSAYEILKPGDQLELNNLEFRGDFESYDEYVRVSFDAIDKTTAKQNSVVIGDFYSYDDNVWHSANGVGDGRTVTVVELPSGAIGFKIYVSPSVNVNFIPFGMNNWWELRADIQFKTK